MAKQPAPGKVHSWAGWIPTVSGQLSFSIIGHSSAAKNCAFVNEILPVRSEAAPVRYVALQQSRTAPDFPYFDFLTKHFWPGVAYDFVCSAQTAEADIQVMLPRNAEGEPRVKAVHNAQGVLKGQIYVLLYNRDKQQRMANRAAIHDLKTSIWSANAENVAEAKKKISRALANRTQSAPPFLVANFQLFRTGEFKLEIEERAWLRFVNRADLKAVLEIIPNQIFYFMKDVVHRHYHHDGSSDQMLALTRLTDSVATSEIGWRRSTLWGLVRVIMQYRRAGRWLDLQKAKGVIAYAEAFQLSFANCIRMPFGPVRFKPSIELGTYDFKHIRDSIEVSIAENTAQRSVVWQGVALALPLILAVLIALSSYGSKVLSLRLAACSPAKDSKFWLGIRDQMGCEDVASASLTFWEYAAASHTFYVMAMLLVAITIFAERYLLDVPFGRSWLGRRWQSVRSTALLLVYAFHSQLVLNARIGSALMRWIKSQIPPAMLLVLLAAEFGALLLLLRIL